MTARAAVRVLGVGAAAGALIGARTVMARRRLLGPVLDELRHPLLLVPLHFGPGTLRLARWLPAPPGSGAPGVDIEQHLVPGCEGGPEVAAFVYDTPTRTRPSGALLWIHGGGFVLGHSAAWHELCSGCVLIRSSQAMSAFREAKKGALSAALTSP